MVQSLAGNNILNLFRSRGSLAARCGLTGFPLIKIIPIWVWRPETTLSCHQSASQPVSLILACKNVKTPCVWLGVVFKDS